MKAILAIFQRCLHYTVWFLQGRVLDFVGFNQLKTISPTPLATGWEDDKKELCYDANIPTRRLKYN